MYGYAMRGCISGLVIFQRGSVEVHVHLTPFGVWATYPGHVAQKVQFPVSWRLWHGVAYERHLNQ